MPARETGAGFSECGSVILKDCVTEHTCSAHWNTGVISTRTSADRIAKGVSGKLICISLRQTQGPIDRPFSIYSVAKREHPSLNELNRAPLCTPRAPMKRFPLTAIVVTGILLAVAWLSVLCEPQACITRNQKLSPGSFRAIFQQAAPRI